jgi:hypothetical protein
MLTKREKYESMLTQLKNERRKYETAWRDITEQLLPDQSTWEVTQQRNRGEIRDSQILNSKPIRSVKTLSAGMMAGVTSPARDWFGLTTADPELAEYDSVRTYLDDCKRLIAASLQSSNWYRSLGGGVYPSMCVIGTAAMFQEESQSVPGGLHFRAMPIGEYYLDIDHEGRVDTCFRELYWTSRQMVHKFGRNACSEAVRWAYDHGNYQQGFVVVHAVTPNEDHEPGYVGSRGMQWSSCWWERSDTRANGFLREGGYEEFPVLAPRWSALPSDAYGRGPGWDARGDCKMLQHHEDALLKLLDKTVDPPMLARGNVKGASLRPGDITQVESTEHGRFEPAYTPDPRALAELKDHIARVENRISECMFAHLWNMLIEDDRNQRPTATEVEAKRKEVMLQLGPLLENLNNELLEPAIERAFAQLQRMDVLPMPPPELEGTDIKIEFISIMHQMQQATGLVSIRTLMQEVQQIAAIRPDVIDKINADAVVDELARITGVRPKTILSQDEVTALRQQRAEQESLREEGQAMLAATQGVKNLSASDPTKLSELVGSLPPAVAAQGGALGSVKEQ